jgi:hypothetical protein
VQEKCILRIVEKIEDCFISYADALGFEIILDTLATNNASDIAHRILVQISKKLDIFDLVILDDIFENNSIIDRLEIWEYDLI